MKSSIIVKLVMAAVFIIASLIIGSQLKAEELIEPKLYPAVRPNLKDLGHGWVLNDLEQHANAGHPMKNPSDVGNWVHELVHLVNNDIRDKTRAHDNAFYLLHDCYVVFPEPKLTLRQVAGMVHESKRNDTYQEYFVNQQRWFNDSPLYLLDEADAFTTSLLYYATTGKRDGWFEHRRRKMNEFIYFAKVLREAIKHHDPKYPAMAELDKYIEWHRLRVEKIERMLDPDNDNSEPDTIVPEPIRPYNIRG